MANDPQRRIHEYARGGYTFTIEARFLSYPYADFKYWAKVTCAVADREPGMRLTGHQLPFEAVQYHAASEAEAVERVKRQINEWFDAHQDADPSP